MWWVHSSHPFFGKKRPLCTLLCILIVEESILYLKKNCVRMLSSIELMQPCYCWWSENIPGINVGYLFILVIIHDHCEEVLLELIFTFTKCYYPSWNWFCIAIIDKYSKLDLESSSCKVPIDFSCYKVGVAEKESSGEL